MLRNLGNLSPTCVAHMVGGWIIIVGLKGYWLPFDFRACNASLLERFLRIVGVKQSTQSVPHTDERFDN